MEDCSDAKGRGRGGAFVAVGADGKQKFVLRELHVKGRVPGKFFEYL